jgi:energy-coupling factor transporter ATP-binding protein EcfA2
MITRIEIDGFKTFKDFSLDLAPFQVIIGANGSGKSNLFDAIRLLSRLADANLHSAFQSPRGDFFEQFTIQPDNQPGECMRFAVEMLVDRKVKDNWGAEVRLPNPRLRYELEIRVGNLSTNVKQLYIVDESLTSIAPGEDHWLKRFVPLPVQDWLSDVPPGSNTFLSTDGASPNNTLIFHQDDSGITQREFQATVAFRRPTGLSRIDNCDFPHILAARQEMKNWGLLEGRPENLRLPSMLFEDTSMVVGNFIPLFLFRMKGIDETLLKDVSRDLSNLVPQLAQIEVEKNEARNQYEVYAQMRDGRRLSQGLLSDGIVRLLLLATIRNYPQAHGVRLFEEPENSIHPAQLKRLVRLMRDMTTDLTDPEQIAKPLKQLLVTTHSPELVSELEMEKGELVFAELVTRIEPGQLPIQVTRMTPVCTEMEGNKAAASYTRLQVLKFLNSDDLESARKQLRKASA